MLFLIFLLKMTQFETHFRAPLRLSSGVTLQASKWPDLGPLETGMGTSKLSQYWSILLASERG